MGLFGSILGLAVPFLGDILGANSSSKAVSKASKAQVAAQQAAIAEQQREYDTSRSDFAPYMDFGKSALGPLGDILGMNGPNAAAAAIQAIKSSPMFSSLFNTGEEAVLQNASATGGVRGGNTQGALYDLGSNTLAQLVNDQISRLFGAAGIGQGSTGSVSTIGAHTADQISNAEGNIGSAQAGKYLGQAGIQNNLYNQLAGLFSPANLATAGIKF